MRTPNSLSKQEKAPLLFTMRTDTTNPTQEPSQSTLTAASPTKVKNNLSCRKGAPIWPARKWKIKSLITVWSTARHRPISMMKSIQGRCRWGTREDSYRRLILRPTPPCQQWALSESLWKNSTSKKWFWSKSSQRSPAKFIDCRH